MKWGLWMIGVACGALLLGVAVVAPSTNRGAEPVPRPSEAVLEASSRPGLRSGRALVEVPVPETVPETDLGPGEAQDPSRTPDSERLDSPTVRETSQTQN